ncbi:uncharacterized protein LAESUDRAFT_765475, partial [Laetiporus sulphureus 93-53]
MGNPATPSSFQHPATPVASPHKAADLKNAVMGIVYSAWEALRKAEPLDSAHDLRAFSDPVSQTRYTQFCQKAQVHLDSFVQPSWLSWCEELISSKQAAAFSVTKELSPPLMTEASACMPSDTGEVMASDSLTASTGADDSLPTAVPTSASVVAAPAVAPAAQGVPVLKFKFQAHAANPVTIDPPSDSDTAAMEVDILLAIMVAKPPSAPVSETIKLSSNDEDDSDSDEVEYMGGTMPNLSPAHPKKGKGRGRKPAKPSGMTAAFEDQYVRMPVRTFRDRSLPLMYLPLWQKLSIMCLCRYCLLFNKACKWWMHNTVPDVDDADGWLSLKKLYHLRKWPLPKMPDAKLIVKASSHQVDYDEQMHNANTAGSDYAAELELPLDTLIDEYEAALAPAPHLRPAHTLPDMPEPDVESDTEGAPKVVTIKQEKGTAGPSR